MRHIAICLTLSVLAAACENSADRLIGIGGTGGGAVTQAQAAGDWSFTLRKTTTLPCSGGSLADGQVITAHLDVLSDGTVTASTSSWQNPPTTTVRPISGLVRLRWSRSAGTERALSAAWRRSSRRLILIARRPPGAQRARSGQVSQSPREKRASRSPLASRRLGLGLKIGAVLP